MSQFFGSLGKRRTLACMLVFLLAGCGRNTGDVSGKVTYQGKPLVCGSVQFAGSDGQPRLSAIDKEGNYSLKNALAGENRILVFSLDPRREAEAARRNRMNNPGKPIEEPSVDPELSKRWFPIPEKYSDPQKSDLVFTIQAGKMNTYDIDLK